MNKKIILLLIVLLMFVASCKKKEYTYIFKDADGTILKQETAPAGSTINYPSNPQDVVDGEYTTKFVRWSRSDEILNEDIVFTAVYETIVNQYTYTFYDSDRKTIIKQETTDFGNDIIYPDDPPSKEFEGYSMIFNGWSSSEKILLRDIDIYAKYKRVNEVYKITFIDYDENVISTYDIEFNDYVRPEDDPNTSINPDNYYKFLGWVDVETNELFDFNNQITKDYTFKPLNESGEYGTLSLSESGISILGDSISTFYMESSKINSMYSGHNEYYYPIYCQEVSSANLTWWYQAILGVNAKFLVNNSLSGSSAYGSTTKAGQSYTRLKALGNKGTPNIIFVFMGVNDNVNGHTIAQIEDAYRMIIEYIQQNYVAKVNDKYIKPVIYLFTYGYTAYSGYNFTNERRLAVNQKFRDLADEYGENVRLFDIDKFITVDNYKDCLYDSLHYNVYGMKLVADNLIAQLKEDYHENNNAGRIRTIKREKVYIFLQNNDTKFSKRKEEE